MARVPIRWENSAQGKKARPNPYVRKSISYVRTIACGARLGALFVADQGCGKLRHFAIFRRFFRNILFVDTEFQITRIQAIGSERTTLLRHVAKVDRGRGRYRVLSSKEFGLSNLALDLIFCVCVFDVVPCSTRKNLIKAAASNLKVGGYYCIIVPRNDQSITSRCDAPGEYDDGHLFSRNGLKTFYANFSAGSRPMLCFSEALARAGLTIVGDLSVHRQLCLICRKAPSL